MSNDVSLDLANFITALLEVDEKTVIIGRTNYKQDKPSDPLVLIDSLIEGTLQATSESYDEDTEIMSYTCQYIGNFTVDFYGDNAATQTTKCAVLLSSQKAFELQKIHEVTPYLPKTVSNLKHLEGKQQTNRHQLELVVHYNLTVNDSVLRIDDVDVTILSDD